MSGLSHNDFRPIALICILLLASSQSSLGQTTQTKTGPDETATQTKIRKLELNQPIERELKGGQSHDYEILLAAGQFLDLVVDQRGVDVVVQVLAPDGKPLLEVDSPNGDQGPEPVSLISEAAGVYRLQVKSLEGNAPAGKYEIRVKALRAATENDRALAEATQLTARAEQLRDAGKYNSALPLAERALSLRDKAISADQADCRRFA